METTGAAAAAQAEAEDALATTSLSVREMLVLLSLFVGVAVALPAALVVLWRSTRVQMMVQRLRWAMMGGEREAAGAGDGEGEEWWSVYLCKSAHRRLIVPPAVLCCAEGDAAGHSAVAIETDTEGEEEEDSAAAAGAAAVAPGEQKRRSSRTGKGRRKRKEKKKAAAAAIRRGSSVVRLRPSELPDDHTPLLCFVNKRSGSGKQEGRWLSYQLQQLLNKRQVFDLSECDPAAVIRSFYPLPGLRILVCGGDGTVGWIMSVLDELELPKQPPLAVLPLGTGNDLARVLGWGAGYSNESLQQLLVQIQNAHVGMVDRWQLEIAHPRKSRGKQAGKAATVSGSFTQPAVVDDGSGGAGWDPLVRMVSFNNYFGIGVDAQAALEFHGMREQKPELFFSRVVNKCWYTLMGLSDVYRHSCKGLPQFLTLEADGKVYELPKDTEGIIFLNINSYGGGVKMWCHPSEDDDLRGPYRYEAVSDDETGLGFGIDAIHSGDDSGPRNRLHSGSTASLGGTTVDSDGRAPGAAGTTTNSSKNKSKNSGHGDDEDDDDDDGDRIPLSLDAPLSLLTRRRAESDELSTRDVWHGSPQHTAVSPSAASLSLSNTSAHSQANETCSVGSSSRSGTSRGHGRRRRRRQQQQQQGEARLRVHDEDTVDEGQEDDGTAADERESLSLKRSMSQRPDLTEMGVSSMQDGMLDVVAVTGSLHLGQTQIGTAQPIKICQCREAVVTTTRGIPLQTDGEPWGERRCRIKISRKRQMHMLQNSTPHDGAAVLAELTAVLDWAERQRVITWDQKLKIHEEFSHRLENRQLVRENVAAEVLPPAPLAPQLSASSNLRGSKSASNMLQQFKDLFDSNQAT